MRVQILGSVALGLLTLAPSVSFGQCSKGGKQSGGGGGGGSSSISQRNTSSSSMQSQPNRNQLILQNGLQQKLLLQQGLQQQMILQQGLQQQRAMQQALVNQQQQNLQTLATQQTDEVLQKALDNRNAAVRRAASQELARRSEQAEATTKLHNPFSKGLASR